MHACFLGHLAVHGPVDELELGEMMGSMPASIKASIKASMAPCWPWWSKSREVSRREVMQIACLELKFDFVDA
jgi:hypothetical protein